MFARHLVVFRWLGLAAAMSTFAFRAVEAETEAIPAGPSLEAAFATDSPGSGSVTAPKASDARPTEPPANPAVPEAPPAGAADPSTSQNDPPATTTDVPESTPAFRIISEPAEELAEPETAEPANPAIPEVSERGLMELPSDGAAALEPVPDPIEHKTPVIEAASFKGVTPGISTLEEVQKAWGAPQELSRRDETLVHLYTIEPFDRIEVSYFEDKVISIVVCFQRAFPAKTVAVQLELGLIVPVLVSNEVGEILGQVYPERGVLFAFEPSDEAGKPSMQVAQIILEPISADSFLLRAETYLTTQYDQSKRDLEYVIGVEPENAKAHWLLSRIHMALGSFEEALTSSAKAVQFETNDVRYRVTRAQVLGQVGELEEAIAEGLRAAELADNRPHVKARALCLLGDLHASGAQPDYRKALKYHMEAIRVAGALAESKHTAVRLSAKEVLIDAHLGAAHDIAWGEWDDKGAAVPKWLARARAVVDDVIENESGDEEHRFRVATRALAACVGMRGEIAPEPFTKEALETGRILIEAADGQRQRTARLRWELGMALYDALQVHQMRGEHETALQFGEQAIGYLEPAGDEPASTTTSYLLGRLYFRLGAIHAIRDGNHDAAVVWFDKAMPELAKPAPPGAVEELGRHGETFVSMGVSYWETKQKERAIELTEEGLKLMEQAVEQGTLQETALAVPYNNLSSMHRQMGREEQARRFEQLANQPGKTQLK